MNEAGLKKIQTTTDGQREPDNDEIDNEQRIRIEKTVQSVCHIKNSTIGASTRNESRE